LFGMSADKRRDLRHDAHGKAPVQVRNAFGTENPLDPCQQFGMAGRLFGEILLAFCLQKGSHLLNDMVDQATYPGTPDAIALLEVPEDIRQSGRRLVGVERENNRGPFPLLFYVEQAQGMIDHQVHVRGVVGQAHTPTQLGAALREADDSGIPSDPFGQTGQRILLDDRVGQQAEEEGSSAGVRGKKRGNDVAGGGMDSLIGNTHHSHLITRRSEGWLCGGSRHAHSRCMHNGSPLTNI